jgi:hypothetical protein
MAPITTQAQLFATEYARDTAREMLDTIKTVGRKAGWVTRIVLAVSMPHQIGFILGLAPLQWDSLEHILAGLTLILGSVLIPVAVDYLILICIQVLAARGMARKVKRAALYLMAFPILVSGTVNVAAPAPLLIRVLFGVAVVLIPMSQWLRANIRPDFRAIEQMETEVAAQVEQPAAGRKLTDEEKASRAISREWNRYQRMSPRERAKYRAEHGGVPVAPKRIVSKSGPVSPGAVPFEELDAELAK